MGIPTMLMRAQQALGKMALEPEWEARFEPNSYGFRAARSCYDAIEAILNAIRYKPKFVFDADISGCFDHINHSVLLAKLNTYPAMKHIIKAWLQARVLEQDVFIATERGTPQGGLTSVGLLETASGARSWWAHLAELAAGDHIKGMAGGHKGQKFPPPLPTATPAPTRVPASPKKTSTCKPKEGWLHHCWPTWPCMGWSTSSHAYERGKKRSCSFAMPMISWSFI